MNNFRVHLIVIGVLFLFSCKAGETDISSNNKGHQKQSSDKVQVLNLGTFHMGFTSDANSTDFDQKNKKNQKKVHKIAEKLSDFDPNVIIVEVKPENNSQLQNEYKSYRKNPGMTFEHPSEIELLAYELGRLSETDRIYGIDHKMRYNYKIGHEINNNIDPKWYNKYYQDPLKFYPEVDLKRDSLKLLKKLKLTNRKRYLDFLKAVNADMLTHAGTEGGFEGADEAAKLYQRNLRMFSNLNRINLEKDDRVFILMGASHTAFFRDFMSGDPKYKMVNTFNYLK